MSQNMLLERKREQEELLRRFEQILNENEEAIKELVRQIRKENA